MDSRLDIPDDIFEGIFNPIECISEVLHAQNWHFDTIGHEEIRVEVKGKFCNYRLFFIWETDMNALQFCVQYENAIHQNNTAQAATALMSANEKLWMGHFDIPSDSNIPTFRHTTLLSGTNSHNGLYEQISELIHIAMAQCERFYTTFHLLSHDLPANEDMMPLALMETRGVS